MGFGHVDYIVTSKRVFTSAVGDDAARPLAFAVVGDRIEFMGTPADVIAACAPGTPVLDFGDAFICPDSTTPTCTSSHGTWSIPVLAHAHGRKRG